MATRVTFLGGDKVSAALKRLSKDFGRRLVESLQEREVEFYQVLGRVATRHQALDMLADAFEAYRVHARQCLKDDCPRCEHLFRVVGVTHDVVMARKLSDRKRR